VRVKTNIDIDERLIGQVMRLTGLRTKRAVVERALQTVVGLHDQGQVRLLRGKLRWEGDLAGERRVRDGDPG
jgi:Arc/MetJ family transcription regulator